MGRAPVLSRKAPSKQRKLRKPRPDSGKALISNSKSNGHHKLPLNTTPTEDRTFRQSSNANASSEDLEREKEYFSSGFFEDSSEDSSVHTDSEDVIEDAEKHRTDLKTLAQDQSQAEFFNYLKHEDPDLLNFEESDVEEVHSSKRSPLTVEILDSWKSEALSGNYKSFKNLFKAYSVAATMKDFLSDDASSACYKEHFEYEISDYVVFNNVLVFVLRNSSNLFDIMRAKFSQEDQNKSAASKSFDKKMFLVINNYWRDSIKLLQTLNDPKMLCFVMRSLEACIKHLVKAEKMQKKLFKCVLKIWGETGEHIVRVVAFLLIYEMSLGLPYPFINYCLKGIYLTFVSYSKFYNSHSQAKIEFMKNCIVEIYGLDMYASYQHAFVYIRELASHLRNAFHFMEKNYLNIFNFQYLNSIRVWVSVLSRYGSCKHFSLLFYPLIQLVQGIISSYKSPTIYPMRLSCVQMLNELARSSGKYVNSATSLFEILLSPELTKHPKKSNSDVRLNLQFIVTVSKSSVDTQVFKTCIFNSVMKLLTEYLVLNCKSVAFPELSSKVMNTLSKFRKQCTNSTLGNEVKRLQKSLLLTSQMLQAKRCQLTLSVKELEDLDMIFDREEEAVTPIEKYYSSVYQDSSQVVGKQSSSKVHSSSASIDSDGVCD